MSVILVVHKTCAQYSLFVFVELGNSQSRIVQGRNIPSYTAVDSFVVMLFHCFSRQVTLGPLRHA